MQVHFRTLTIPSEDWTRTPLWSDAAVLPNTTAMADPGGALAKQFGVKTSGHVLLYSADGKLLFSGGITPSRGDEGANPGRNAVVALLKGQVAQSESPVFGCPLFDSSDARESGKTCPTP